MEDELTLIGVFTVLVESWELIAAYQNLAGNPARARSNLVPYHDGWRVRQG